MSRLLNTRDFLAEMPQHARQQLAREIGKLDTAESRATHADAIKAMREFDERERQLKVRQMALFGSKR